MNLPPIIANSPLLKLFKSEPAQKSGPKEAASLPAQPQDVVEISAAAQKRLEGVRPLRESEVPATLQEAKAALKDSDVALGLDPNFTE